MAGQDGAEYQGAVLQVEPAPLLGQPVASGKHGRLGEHGQR